MRGPILRAVLASVLLSGVALPELAAAVTRPYTVEDYLKQQRVEEAGLAPTGDRVVVTFSRPRQVGDNYRDPVPDSRLSPRNDLVVLSTRDGRVLFRAEGLARRVSMLSPRWSPDGQRLAYLVRAPDAEISLVVWDARSGQTRTLARGVRGAEPVILDARGASAPYAWNRADEIVLTRAGNLREEQAADAQAAKRRGESGSLSVRAWQTLSAPVCRPNDEVIALRMDGRSSLVRQGGIASVTLSPAGDQIIVAERTGRIAPPARTALAKPLAWGASAEPMLSTWSATPYRRAGATWTRQGPGVDGRGAVLARTAPRWGASGAWAVLDTVDPAAVDPEVRILQVDATASTPRATAMPDQKSALKALAAFAGSTDDPEPGPDLSRLSPDVRAMLGPAPETLSSAADGAVLSSRTNGVTSLWYVRRGEARRLMTLNSHLADLRAPHAEALVYRANGEERRGWLFMPDGAKGPVPVVVAGYPMNTARTTRAMDPDGTPELLMLRERGIAIFIADFRLQNAGQRDFAYTDAVDRVRTELGAAAKALRQDSRLDGSRLAFTGHSFGGYTAISLLAHSTDFKAIVAAAPLADLVSYFSETPNYAINQTCGPEQSLRGQANHEGIGEDLPGNRLFTLPGPPYAWPEIYAKNSPILHLGQAVTPTLIIQGSEDGFRDGDRVFNTLYRLGVDAELLYYWGEGHVISNPENLRDKIERTVEWLQAHLK